MTTTRSTPSGRMTIGEIIGAFATGEPPLRIEAYDGSAIGPADSDLVLRLKSEKALQYFVTAPGDLGLARAYLMGELELQGVHPGAPHDVFGALEVFRKFMTRRPDARTMLQIARSIGTENVTLLPVPDQEVPPAWKRVANGLRRHSKERDSAVVSYHYDVSNRFYEWILGPSMTYTCAAYPDVTPRSRTRRRTSTASSLTSSDSSRATACWTWAAAGAGWCATPRVTESTRSA